MPYIKPDARREIDNGRPPANAGELNYCITTFIQRLEKNEGISPRNVRVLSGVHGICRDYIEAGGTNYQKINDAIGAIVCAASEYVRRTNCEPLYNWNRIIWSLYIDVAAPYEDSKIKENGDIFQ